VAQSDQVWVTGITYICTFEGRLLLTVVLDLYAAWAMEQERRIARYTTRMDELLHVRA
jgi:hypothetical protein